MKYDIHSMTHRCVDIRVLKYWLDCNGEKSVSIKVRNVTNIECYIELSKVAS